MQGSRAAQDKRVIKWNVWYLLGVVGSKDYEREITIVH